MFKIPDKNKNFQKLAFRRRTCEISKYKTDVLAGYYSLKNQSMSIFMDYYSLLFIANKHFLF